MLLVISYTTNTRKKVCWVGWASITWTEGLRVKSLLHLLFFAQVYNVTWKPATLFWQHFPNNYTNWYFVNCNAVKGACWGAASLEFKLCHLPPCPLPLRPFTSFSSLSFLTYMAFHVSPTSLRQFYYFEAILSMEMLSKIFSLGTTHLQIPFRFHEKKKMVQ